MIRPRPGPLWYDAARVRIVLDYRPALRERTGVGQFVHELAAALQGLLAPDDSLILFSSSWKDRLDRRGLPAAIRVVDARVPVRVLNAAWHRLEWPPVELFAGTADIAHSFHPLMMPARTAARIVTIHDLDFLDHPDRTRAEIRRDYPSLVASHAARADLVVVNSNYTASRVRERLGIPDDRLVVCRPGVPAAWEPRGRQSPEGPILFVGTIEPRKNLPTLFAAYETLVHRMPSVPELVLAGRSVEQSDSILEAARARPSIAGRMRYLGYVSEAARYSLFSQASMLVLPSLDEGFGMTALEAMHMGLPVVASNRGALPEVLGDAAALVDATDAAAMAGEIERLLRDEGLRGTRASAGRARARGFTWCDSARGLLAAYRAVAVRRARSRPC